MPNRAFIAASLVMSLSGFASSASAGAVTVGDLKEMCTATDDVNVSRCTFFMLGVASVVELFGPEPKVKAHVCFPDGTTNAQMVFVVKKAIGEDLMFYPKDTELEAGGFVAAALSKQWPCRKAKP